jgi:RNA polymerase sigma-70 factor (ECF subfamily)
MVSQPVEAEDIMQEAFISAFDRLDTFKGEVSFGAWLKKIVINKSIDALRHKKVRPEEVHASGEDEVKDVFIDFEEDNGNDPLPLVNQIKEAMKKLPDGYRVVLTLALLEGYDHEEIAQILSVNESTSRSQLVRAKRKLGELLKDKIL